MPSQVQSEAETLGELVDYYAGHFSEFAEDELKIKAKNRQTIPFVLNRVQLHIHDILETQHGWLGRVRAYILKGRQQGCSTYVSGRFFHRVEFLPGTKAFILTHEQQATQNVYEMQMRYHDNLSPCFQMETVQASAKEIRFAVVDSGIKTGTAGTRGTGRSQTVQCFHGSEVALWPHSEDHASGILQSVPNEPGTEIILESTAYGVGNLFHTGWSEAWAILRDKYDGDIFKMAAGHHGYIPIFIPWFWQKEYAEPFRGGELTEKEIEVKAKHNLTDEQIQWRRDKIDELKSEDLFRQEYPCTPEEAFLLSGRPFFPTEAIERIKKDEIRKPLATGVLEQTGNLLRFVPQSNGWLQVYEYPEAKVDYVVGVDVSEGLPHGDLNSGHVLARGVISEQVARFSPLCEPDTLGRYSVLVAKYYNGAALGIERNGLGISAVIAARDTEYDFLYCPKKTIGTRGEMPSLKIGWETTTVSRKQLCNDLLASVRDAGVLIHSDETVGQMQTFVRGQGGRPEGSPGCKDDDPIGLGIAVQMLLHTEPKDRGRGDEEKFPGGFRVGPGRGGWMA